MKRLRLTSFMMVAAAASFGLAPACSSSSSKGGTGGAGGGLAGSTGTAGAAGGTTGSLGGATGVGGAAGGSTGIGGAAGGSTGGGGAAGGSTGTAGAAGGSMGTAGAAGGSTGTAGAAGGSTGTAGAAGGTTGGGGAGGAAVTTLLVDHDDSDNNDDSTQPPSTSDTFFAARLTAEHIPFATTIVADMPNPTTPHFADLMPYSTIVWYTGSSFGKTMTASQQTTLKNWLGAGGKTLLVFSDNLIYDLGDGGNWTTLGVNTFLSDDVGAAGWGKDADQFVNGQDVSLNHTTYTVTGAAGTAFAGLQFTIVADTPIDSTADIINPATGTVPLVTVQSDVDDSGTNVAAPIAVVHTVGTSKVLYVGLPVEDIQGAPTNTGAEFVHAALKTLGLVQ